MFLLLKSWPSNSFVFNTAHTWYMALGCRRFSFLTFHIRSRRTLGSELLSLPKRSSRTFLRYSFLDAPWATILGFDTTNSIWSVSVFPSDAQSLNAEDIIGLDLQFFFNEKQICF